MAAHSVAGRSGCRSALPKLLIARGLLGLRGEPGPCALSGLLRLALIGLVFSAHTAAGQTQRAEEMIERALALSPDTNNGFSLYREFCESCHRARAVGNARTATPALAGQTQRYLLKQLADFAEGDRSGPEMHRAIAPKALTTLQASRDLAQYLSSLPNNSSPEVGDGTRLELGKAIYSAACSVCHGVSGEGQDDFAVPSLRGQHYSYILSQVRSLAVGHRYSVPVEVIATLEDLGFDEITAVADYISRLPASEAQSDLVTD